MASPVGLEPTTFRLTAERANRLRHGDNLSSNDLDLIKLPLWPRAFMNWPRKVENPVAEKNGSKFFRKHLSYAPGFQEKFKVHLSSSPAIIHTVHLGWPVNFEDYLRWLVYPAVRLYGCV